MQGRVDKQVVAGMWEADGRRVLVGKQERGQGSTEFGKWGQKRMKQGYM